MNASREPLPLHPTASASEAGSGPEDRRAAPPADDVRVIVIDAQPPTGACPTRAPIGPDRRKSGGRRRETDRLMDRATRDYPMNAALNRVRDIETMMMFVDDDLRETTLAIGRIETYLVRTLQTLERRDVSRADVLALAGDMTILEHLDGLNETVESLRRRLARLAGRMR